MTLSKPATSDGGYKIFSDNIHSHLELPWICFRFINTPQFQRLRNLKQLGLCNFVYPSAGHSRFEHCIGTSYLAGKYVEILRRKQPELGITDVDVKCLYLAGLCHDIGHGPFSHTWERFMHSMPETPENYSHEKMSLKLIDHMIEKNNLGGHLEKEGIGKQDIEFIKELILGHPQLGKESVDFLGRPDPKMRFLYQIVSNELTKIDVDKFDYLLRDGKQLNVPVVFEYQRLMDNSRVVAYETVDGEDIARALGVDESLPTKIVYRKKIEGTIADLFRSRFSLHQKAYQHRVTKVIEEMVLEGLQAAEPHFEVAGGNGNLTLSTAYKELDAFIKLTDSIFERILLWGDGGPEAQRIFGDVINRKLYTYLGYFWTSAKIDGEELNELREGDESLRFFPTPINYGSGKSNPLSKVQFYEKRDEQSKLNSLKDQKNPEEWRTFIVSTTIGLSNEERKVKEQRVQAWAEQRGEAKIRWQYE